uniref:caldesmon isoform X2 n=1 Tax=Ciona intestinalis TaxID=7719 RepID=UPI00089DBA00|nr:caldesmon isoform X2 [Ciona intestinalis]|eukprot:XP_026689940.1 caldesmon isoform X2 [Ciona intestinalis]
MTDVIDDSVSWEQRREMRRKKRQELLAEADRLVKKTDEVSSSPASTRISKYDDDDDEFEKGRQRRRREREERRKKEREELEKQLKDEEEARADRDRRREERRRMREEESKPEVESYTTSTVVSKVVETQDDEYGNHEETETTTVVQSTEIVVDYPVENGDHDDKDEEKEASPAPSESDHAEEEEEEVKIEERSQDEEEMTNGHSETEPDAEPHKSYKTSVTTVTLTSKTTSHPVESNDDAAHDEVQEKLNALKLKRQESEKKKYQTDSSQDDGDAKSKLKMLEEKRKLREQKRLEEEEREKEEALKREAEYQEKLRIEKEERTKRRLEAEAKRQEYRKQLSKSDDEPKSPLSPKGLASPLASKKPVGGVEGDIAPLKKNLNLQASEYLSRTESESKNMERNQRPPAVPRRTQSARIKLSQYSPARRGLKVTDKVEEAGAISHQPTRPVGRKNQTRRSLDAMEKQAGDLLDFLTELEGKKASSSASDLLHFLDSPEKKSQSENSSPVAQNRFSRGKRVSVKDRAKLFLKPDIKEEESEHGKLPSTHSAPNLRQQGVRSARMCAHVNGNSNNNNNNNNSTPVEISQTVTLVVEAKKENNESEKQEFSGSESDYKSDKIEPEIKISIPKEEVQPSVRRRIKPTIASKPADILQRLKDNDSKRNSAVSTDEATIDTEDTISSCESDLDVVGLSSEESDPESQGDIVDVGHDEEETKSTSPTEVSIVVEKEVVIENVVENKDIVDNNVETEKIVEKTQKIEEVTVETKIVVTSAETVEKPDVIVVKDDQGAKEDVLSKSERKETKPDSVTVLTKSNIKSLDTQENNVVEATVTKKVRSRRNKPTIAVKPNFNETNPPQKVEDSLQKKLSPPDDKQEANKDLTLTAAEASSEPHTVTPACKQNRVEQLSKHASESPKTSKHVEPVRVGSLDSRMEKYAKQASKQETKKTGLDTSVIARDVSNRRNKWERGEVTSADKTTKKHEVIPVAGNISSRKNMWERGTVGTASKSSKGVADIKTGDFSSRKNKYLETLQQRGGPVKKAESPVAIKTGVANRLNKWEKGEVGSKASFEKQKSKGDLPASGVGDRRNKWETLATDTAVKSATPKASVRLVTTDVSNRKNLFESKAAATEQPEVKPAASSKYQASVSSGSEHDDVIERRQPERSYSNSEGEDDLQYSDED